MLSLSRSWPLPLAAIAVYACGARSPLEDAALIGVGGATSTTSATVTTSSSTGSGGEAGSGGSAPICNVWDPTATWITKGFFPQQYSFAPRLAPMVSDQSLYHLAMMGEDDLGGRWLWDVDLDAWSAPDGSNNELDDGFSAIHPGLEYALGPGRFEGTAGILVPSTSPGPLGVELLDVDTYASNIPGAPRPLFVSRRTETASQSGELLLGYELAEGNRRRLGLRLVSSKWGAVEHTQAAACANVPLAAKAVGIPDAFLFVAGSSRDVGACDDPGDSLGPPTRLQVTYYSQPLGQVLNPMLEWDATGSIEKIDTTLVEGSMWITYSIPNDDSDTSRVLAARVGLTGGLLAGPFDVATVVRPAMFSATRLGTHLAIATVERTDVGQIIVPVRTIGLKGEVSTAFNIVPSTVSDVAIAGEPSGKRMIVALARGLFDGTPGVTVTRYGCL